MITAKTCFKYTDRCGWENYVLDDHDEVLLVESACLWLWRLYLSLDNILAGAVAAACDISGEHFTMCNGCVYISGVYCDFCDFLIDVLWTINWHTFNFGWLCDFLSSINQFSFPLKVFTCPQHSMYSYRSSGNDIPVCTFYIATDPIDIKYVNKGTFLNILFGIHMQCLNMQMARRWTHNEKNYIWNTWADPRIYYICEVQRKVSIGSTWRYIFYLHQHLHSTFKRVRLEAGPVSI